MARLPNLSIYNDERLRSIKIQTAADEAMVLTFDETKELLRGFINDELNFFADDVSKQRRLEMEERINFRLRQIENSMVSHISDKIDKITERIVELSINRIIEEEVESRLNKKLEKIKKEL